MAGEDAAEQAGGGAGIAHVEHVLRLDQAADAAAGDAPPAGCVVHDLGAEGAHGGGGAEHVLALQQALDMGFADGQAREHEGAMADAFIAGHGDAAGEGAGRAAAGQRSDGVHGDPCFGRRAA